MDKVQIGTLVEELIRIRDKSNLNMDDKDTLAEACNLIYHNIDKLSDEE